MDAATAHALREQILDAAPPIDNGSEKQKKWAFDLRANAVLWNLARVEPTGGAFAAVCALAQVASARWWIDHRFRFESTDIALVAGAQLDNEETARHRFRSASAWWRVPGATKLDDERLTEIRDRVCEIDYFLARVQREVWSRGRLIARELWAAALDSLDGAAVLCDWLEEQGLARVDAGDDSNNGESNIGIIRDHVAAVQKIINGAANAGD